MRKRIQAWLRGPIIAIGSMALYAIALGCFLALMLLVISMEEGGENLSSSTLDMTRIVVLLSQGIGFETDSLSLSIMPLLLTVLLIGLVWSFSRKICTDIRAYVSGVVVWIFINVMGTQSLPVGLLDWYASNRPWCSRLDSPAPRCRRARSPGSCVNLSVIMCPTACAARSGPA